MAHKHHRRYPVCPNCQQALTPQNNYCPNCGQENHDLRLPFGHVIYEVVESFTHFDGKLWVTLRDMFTRPGQVPLDFIEGRRQRHVPPIRLYVFVSFVLFLLINVSLNSNQERAAQQEELLRLTYGPDKAFRVLTLSQVFKTANQPAPDLTSVDVGVQFPMADSTGAQTLRRWRQFSDAQLDSLLQLYDYKWFDNRRPRLRKVISALPTQLPQLRLLEPVGARPLPLDVAVLKKARVDTTLPITLRYQPQDTLGTLLTNRLKALSTADRQAYARLNNVLPDTTPRALAQFARVVDSLTPRPANDPLRHSFIKGGNKFNGFEYTTEAAARADVRAMQRMNPDERVEFYFKRNDKSDEPDSSVTFSDWSSKQLLKRLINQYVRNFEKSDTEVSTAQFNKVVKYASYSFFLLMPLVAVFLYVAYRRHKRFFYVDHLIFSLNMHTLGFLLYIVAFVLFNYTPLPDYVSSSGLSINFFDPLTVAVVLLAGPVPYFLLSLRRVYRQSWPKTLLKGLVLSALYAVTLVYLMKGTAFLAILS